MLRENIQFLSESIFQRKQNNLGFGIYLLFLAALVGRTVLLRNSKDRNCGGQLDLYSVLVPCSKIQLCQFPPT